MQTLKNRLAQRNKNAAVAAKRSRRLALALVLWQVSCGSRIERGEEEEEEEEEEDNVENQSNRDRDHRGAYSSSSSSSRSRAALGGTSRLSKSEMRRKKAGFRNW